MIIRVCLCIPTYNNAKTIEEVVVDCLQKTQYPLLVVDDGSDEPVEGLLRSSQAREAMESGRLRVLRFAQNQGKGAALRAAILDCVSHGFTHLFSIDGDGQHLTSEIPKLVELAHQHPWDLIVGCRKLSGATVPTSTVFGRKFSNFWVNFQTGTPIRDSQSGFRLYPLFHLQNMSFWTRKYDFEIEVLIRLLWKGVAIREAEIDVYYPPKDERISHFNKFWDNARISILNTALVLISMLKLHRSPHAIAMALGIGVWIGCTPFFGFHTLIVLAVASIFPLNALFLFIGSQISAPPFVPFLVLASIEIGARLAPDHDHAFHYVVGSFILGGLLFLITWATAFFVSAYLRKVPSEKVTWNGRSRGGRVGNWVIRQITRYLGLRAAYVCIFFAIPYFYLFAPKARRSINEYWKIVRPDMGFFQRQRQIFRHFFNFAQVLLDRVYQSFHTENIFIANSNGIENILDVTRAKQGVILLSAHIGAWDLACTLLEKNGFSSEFHLFQYQSKELNFEKLKGDVLPASLKSHFVEATATHHEPQLIFQIRELLDLGLPIGLMGDRPLSHHFELVPFFGKLAPFDVTPFRIAAACHRPLLFSFGFKAQGMTYDFYAEPLKLYEYTHDAPKALQCYRWLEEYTTVLEKMLRRYPLSWNNFYPFWSSLPKSPVAADISKQPNYSAEEARRPATS
jgi:predicted LPLAT superfamily acyltransferase/glycosyltransferase involved in cell wall biosynthesis